MRVLTTEKARKPNTDVAYKPDLTTPNMAKNGVISKVKFYKIFYNNFLRSQSDFAGGVFCVAFGFEPCPSIVYLYVPPY
jgi:hypothetical protein